jgi:hypothetical protein
MRARGFLLIGLLIALVAIVVGSPPRCGTIYPAYCVGKIIEITNLNDSTTRLLVQSVTLEGQPFDYAGDQIETADSDYIQGVSLDDNRYAFINVDLARRLREVSGYGWIIDALLITFVIAMSLLVLVMVALDRRRQLRPAPPGDASHFPPYPCNGEGVGGRG